MNLKSAKIVGTLAAFLLFSCPTEGKTSFPNLRKYVFKILLDNDNYQVGFKLEGKKGIYTSLHGFIETYGTPTKDFSNYVIKGIKSWDYKSIYSFPGDNKNKPNVQLIDMAHDLVYIDFNFETLDVITKLGYVIKLNDGFSPDSSSNPDFNQLTVFHWANGQSFMPNNSIYSTCDIDYVRNIKLADTSDLSVLFNIANVPFAGTKVIQVKDIYKGSSGAPIINTQTEKLVGVAFAGDNSTPNTPSCVAWMILPNFEKHYFRAYSQIDKDSLNNFGICYFDLSNLFLGNENKISPYKLFDSLSKEYELNDRNNKETVKGIDDPIHILPFAVQIFEHTGYIKPLLFISKSLEKNLSQVQSAYLPYAYFGIAYYNYIEALHSHEKWPSWYSRDSSHYKTAFTYAKKLYFSNPNFNKLKSDKVYWGKYKYNFPKKSKWLILAIQNDSVCPSLTALASKSLKEGQYQEAKNILSESQLYGCDMSSIANIGKAITQKTDSSYKSYMVKADLFARNGKQDSSLTYYYHATSVSFRKPEAMQKIKRLKQAFPNAEAAVDDSATVRNLQLIINGIVDQYQIKHDILGIRAEVVMETESYDKYIKVTFNTGSKTPLNKDSSNYVANVTRFNYDLGKYKNSLLSNTVDLMNQLVNVIYSKYGYNLSQIKFIGHADSLSLHHVPFSKEDFGPFLKMNSFVLNKKNVGRQFVDLIHGDDKYDKNLALAYLRALYLKKELQPYFPYILQVNDDDINSLVEDRSGPQLRQVTIEIYVKVSK